MLESDESMETDVSATVSPIVQQTSMGCTTKGDFYANGADIPTEDPCEHCYCLNGDMMCSITECMGPLDGETDSCSPQAPPPGECCPQEYNCSKLIYIYY